MFMCENCGHVTETPKETQETIGEFHGQAVTEARKICSLCGGEMIPAKQCKRCRGWTLEDDDFCEGCKEYVKLKFENTMTANFTDLDRELLNILYEGERI